MRSQALLAACLMCCQLAGLPAAKGWTDQSGRRWKSANISLQGMMSQPSGSKTSGLLSLMSQLSSRNASSDRMSQPPGLSASSSGRSGSDRSSLQSLMSLLSGRNASSDLMSQPPGLSASSSGRSGSNRSSLQSLMSDLSGRSAGGPDERSRPPSPGGLAGNDLQGLMTQLSGGNASDNAILSRYLLKQQQSKPSGRRPTEQAADFDSRYLNRIQKVAGGNDDFMVQFEIFVYREYNGVSAPPGPQLLVQAEVLPQRLSHQSELGQETLSVRLTLRLTWRDTRLQFRISRLRRVSLYSHFVDKLWKPAVQFDANGRAAAGANAVVEADGQVTLEQRMTVSLVCSSQLSLLPLDEPDCRATLKDGTRLPDSQQRLEWLPSNTSDWPIGAQLGDTVLGDVRLLTEPDGGLTLRLQLRRQLARFLCGAYAPGALLVAMAAHGLHAARPGFCALCAAGAFLLWLLAQQTYPQAPVSSLLSLWLLGCSCLCASASFGAALLFTATTAKRSNANKTSSQRRLRHDESLDDGRANGDAVPMRVAAELPLVAASVSEKAGRHHRRSQASAQPRCRMVRAALLLLYAAASVAFAAAYATVAVMLKSAAALGDSAQ